MKREDIFSLIIYIAMIAIALVVGFVIIYPAFENSLLLPSSGAGERIGYLIVTIVIGVVLNAIFVELGHLIGGLLGGYEILSLNILGICFYSETKEDKKKWSLKIRAFDGLAGETEICPKKEKANLTTYVLGPLVFFLIELIVMYICIVLIPDRDGSRVNDLNWLKYAVIIITTIACMYALYNYYPTRLDSLNDGFRMVSLPKKINIEAYNKYLTILGKGLITKKDEELTTYLVTTDFTAETNLLSVYQALVFEDYEKANTLLSEIIKAPKISRYTVLEARIERYFVKLLTTDNIEELKDLYQKSFTKSEISTIKKVYDVKSLRVYMLYVGLVEDSKSEVRYCENKFSKLIKEQPRGFVEAETILYKRAQERLEAFQKTPTIQ